MGVKELPPSCCDPRSPVFTAITNKRLEVILCPEEEVETLLACVRVVELPRGTWVFVMDVQTRRGENARTDGNLFKIRRAVLAWRLAVSRSTGPVVSINTKRTVFSRRHGNSFRGRVVAFTCFGSFVEIRFDWAGAFLHPGSTRRFHHDSSPSCVFAY